MILITQYIKFFSFSILEELFKFEHLFIQHLPFLNSTF